jgi:hypothetical protein
LTSSSNIPGSRLYSNAWKDSVGNFWLFGGNGYDSAGLAGELNDLWKYDGTNWTWISGSGTRNQTGVYGTQYVPAASNIIGGRISSMSWKDNSGNFWLFGGSLNTGTATLYNNLWQVKP